MENDVSLKRLIYFHSLHIMFAILENVRTNFPEFYPDLLAEIFPLFHYPFYR